MTAVEKHLYTRYFYNSVIEFIYFVILYLETCGTASLYDINKYVKFFKTEVKGLISLFEGNAVVDKLHQMLNTFDCFIICENRIRINKNINWKNVLFEDLVLSKCVDLLLRGQNNVDDLCKNLNFNSVIVINKQNLLHIIEKYSYFCICSNQTITLHHVNGLLGFDDYLFKSVIGYFHDILHHGKILSLKEIKNHSNSLSSFGLYNMVGIYSTLHCSSQFDCKEGYILLNNKSKKYQKQKPICIERMEVNFSRSLSIGQIVHNIYGPFLHQWIGEIATLQKSYGVIFCVVDFTNGNQGLFSIYFSKTELKVISELDNLVKYLNVRDVVKFDAEFYHGKMSDRCWKATRVTLLSNKLQYDESLCDKLRCDSKLQRNECSNNMSYSKEVNSTMNVSVTDSPISKDKKDKEKRSSERQRTSDYDSWSSNDSSNGMEITHNNEAKLSSGQEVSVNFDVFASNESIVDYMLMFGHVFFLMKDKGIAIAKHEDKFYNILFMLESVYSPNSSKHSFLKGQKVLAFIPFIESFEKPESLYFATLVYGLNENETNETEVMNIPPKEFADKIILNSLNNFCGHHNFLNGLSQEILISDLRYKMELTELYYFIKSQCEMPFTIDQMPLLLCNICKANSNDRNFGRSAFEFFTKLAEYLPKHTSHKKLGVKNKRKLNADNSLGTLGSSLSSYVTCSTDDLEVFYSCESEFNSPKKSNLSFDNGSLSLSSIESSPAKKEIVTEHDEVFSHETSPCDRKTPSEFVEISHEGSFSEIRSVPEFVVTSHESSVFEARIVPNFEVTELLSAILNNKSESLSLNSSQDITMKVQQSYKNDHELKKDKYLSLQSIQSLKHSTKQKKKGFSSSTLKSYCTKCTRNSITQSAKIILINKYFYLFTTKIDGNDVILPLPKESIPLEFQKNIKLNSSSEITIIPSRVPNLSHILIARIFT